MKKSLIKRGQVLDFVGDFSYFSPKTDSERIFLLNNKEITQGDVIYLMEREHRVCDNWGLIFAYEKSLELNKNLRVIFGLQNKKFSPVQFEFMMSGLKNVENDLKKNNIDFEILEENVLPYLQKYAGMVVTDFNPVQPKEYFVQNLDCAFFEVDSHNIIPCRIASQKQEFSAATFRPKIYKNLEVFLTEYPCLFKVGFFKTFEVLEDFIERKLQNYCEFRNNPTLDATSGLSKYLHFGQISSQRVALEVLKSNASRDNKEDFLEELIVRKELSDNFCFYNPCYDNYEGCPSWAKQSLESHRDDFRQYIYEFEVFEKAQTHDMLWNACQKQLLAEGKIHGYLRMYWAKKILEWSSSPEEALDTAICLNDMYALDGMDSNGYVGVLWAIGGLHDRAFSEREVFGKIRYMSESGCRRKFDTAAFVKKFE